MVKICRAAGTLGLDRTCCTHDVIRIRMPSSWSTVKQSWTRCQAAPLCLTAGTRTRRLLWEPWTGLDANDITKQRAALHLISSGLLGASLSQTSVLASTRNTLSLSFKWSSPLPQHSEIHIRKMLGATIPGLSSNAGAVLLENQENNMGTDSYFSAFWGTNCPSPMAPLARCTMCLLCALTI